MTFEHIFYMGLAGFIGVNVNVWVTRPLNNLKIGKNNIPWGSIIINALTAFVLGFLITQLQRDTAMFQYLCVGLVGSIGSSYAFYSDNIITKWASLKLRMAQILRLGFEIGLDTFLLIMGMQIGPTLF